MEDEWWANESRMTDMVYSYRHWFGLAQLNQNDTLKKVAEAYAKAKATNAPLPRWETLLDRLDNQWYKGTVVAQNVSYYPDTYTSADLVMRDWSLDAEQNKLLVALKYNEVWYGYYSWYRVMIVWHDDFLQWTQTAPVCPRAFASNSYKYRYEHGTDCVTTESTPVVAKKTSTNISTDLQKVLDILNKVYKKILNWKQFYIK